MQVTEVLLARADELAWELGLRGHEAVHLASALLWQEGMGERVTVATFDRQLWEAANQRGMICLPDDLLGRAHSARQAPNGREAGGGAAASRCLIGKG